MEKKMDMLMRRWILGELEMLELRNVCKAFGDVWVLPFRVNRLGIGLAFQDLRLATQMTVCESVLQKK
jgi:hypothetical protein